MHITPVLHINNNKKGGRRVWGGDGRWDQEDSVPVGTQTGYGQGSGKSTQDAEAAAAAGKTGVTSVNGASADAMEVLNRIEREKDEVRLREVEEATRKREEAERIASIMNSNRVDVNAFIEEGRSKRDSGVSTDEKVSSDVGVSPSDEEMRRAQEIIDRLNREAAEDEAKKQAEIEAAREKAREAGV